MLCSIRKFYCQDEYKHLIITDQNSNGMIFGKQTHLDIFHKADPNSLVSLK